jgi:hypothetical protein
MKAANGNPITVYKCCDAFVQSSAADNANLITFFKANYSKYM